jgi:hypothetical protein
MSYKIPRRGADGVPPPAAAPPPEAGNPAAAAPPEEHVGDFYRLSAVLTGFDDVELLGTGVGNLYLNWLLRAFPDVMPALLTAWRDIERDVPPPERPAALRATILGDAVLGPFARSVIVLWYTATWRPPDWTATGAHNPENVDRSFGVAYPEGLMWRAALAAHPGGAKPTGFNTWASPPGVKPSVFGTRASHPREA